MNPLADLDLTRLVGQIALRDPAAAPQVRALGMRLLSIAEALEAESQDPFKTPSGMTDRVKMRVQRPDGTETTTDTGAS